MRFFCFSLTDDAQTVYISRKSILSEMVRGIGMTEPTYDTRSQTKGFYSYVKVSVQMSYDNSEITDLWAYSDGPLCSAYSAEEEVARRMIDLLKKRLNIEVDDVNWHNTHM